MSHANLFGVVMYALVMLASLHTAFDVGIHRDRKARFWFGGALFFAVLALIRLLDVEESSRDFLRKVFRVNALYDGRSSVQVPLVLAIALFASLIALLMRRRWNAIAKDPLSRTRFIASAAMLAFLPLYALRLVSLHDVDKVLYSGGILRPNWLLDIGLSLTVAGAAFAYRRAYRKARSVPRTID